MLSLFFYGKLFSCLYSGVTGGQGGKSTTVTTLDALRSAVTGDSPKIVIISGMIAGDGETVDVGSSTTVYCTAKSGMTGGGFRIKKAKNVIVRPFASLSCLL